jgi:cell volume regulation protein A
MVIRGGESLPAESRTVLRHGDDLLVVAPRGLREQTERRLRQVSRHGRLAGWIAPLR